MTSKSGLEFKVGDAVVYPAHGVGKVAAVETQEVATVECVDGPLSTSDRDLLRDIVQATRA